ncbi:MAG: acyltransferase [Streptosporangiaceae bacterium]|jgi:diacylglycerol O-acyltransferase|nr:acyltransferase [Streptosporangiaceae bacterium]
MSGLDASFFLIEDENTPLHVASVVVFEGPPPSYGDLVRKVVSKLPQIPRYRQRVRSLPLHLGRPVWTDDPHFQILYHLRHTAVPAPGNADQLRNLAGRVLGQRLDPSKPLWEIWLVEGLEDGRWALIGKVHHCMVDGVAGIDLLTALFDLSPDATEHQEPEPWEPEPEPSELELVLDGLRQNLAGPVRGLNALPGLVGSLRNGREIREFAGGLSRSVARFVRPSASSLNGPIGPHRRWCWVQGDLDEVRTIRRALGGTVNDVVLAAVTRGFRDLLEGRGELSPAAVVRTAVPVSLRTSDDKDQMTNRIAPVFLNLPCGEADPLHRLHRIRKQMDDLKRSHQEVGSTTLTRLTNTAVAPALLTLAARTPMRLHNPMVQTITTNVPGPPFPLYVLGRKVVELHPYVPIAGGMRVATAIFSYLGKLNFGLTGDFDAMPDLEVLAQGIRAGFDELTEKTAEKAAR